MSIELRAAESAAIQTLWESWKASENLELESTLKSVNLTGFLDTVSRLRAVGLRETPQQPKLNICMPRGLRFTIVGLGNIQAYCTHGDISQVAYSVMLKEKRRTGGALDQVDLPDYGVRIKLCREIPLSKRDGRVVELVSRWAKAPKRFRYIRRYTFTGPAGVRFDLSSVKESPRDSKGDFISAENFQMADILKQPIRYEIESEAQRVGANMISPKAFINSIGLLLQGMQRSFVLVRNKVANEIVQVVASSTGTRPGSFPGPQPATLGRKHLVKDGDAGVPNLYSGNYNVTDKADGLRCLLVVAKDGRIYLADGALRIYATGLVGDAAYAGAVLDGEWIRTNKKGQVVSLYYAFDIFTTAGGQNVAGLPFLVPDTDMHRYAYLKSTIDVLSTAVQTVKDIPQSHSLLITIKSFISTGGAPGYIYRDASACRDAAAGTEYNTDGLIFTPNADPLPVGGGTWAAQLKWKPPHENTIDFLVVPEMTESGDELIDNKYRDGQMVQYKTLRLFVGGSMDPLLRDPRETVLNKLPLPESIDESYRPLEFKPIEPSDPMASVCNVAINAGAMDPASAAPAVQDMEAQATALYCTRSKDIITPNSIVEMAYNPDSEEGWRWEPIRVRWDKTERYQHGKMAMNADWVAEDVWNSIHNPVTETMIRTGLVEDEVVDKKEVYYARKRSAERDSFIMRTHNNFHNEFIKSQILLQSTLKKGDALLDLACGRGGDLHKWLKADVGLVFGMDVNQDCLIAPETGAYGRYLKRKIQSKRPIAPMVFVQADATRNIRDMSAASSDLDRNIIRALYDIPGRVDVPPAAEELRGAASRGFNVVSCMFALHYFFHDRKSVDGFLRNVAENLNVGGFFVGCCFDGDAVYSLLADTAEGSCVSGKVSGKDVWTIKRNYGDSVEDVLPATDSGLGKAIDVFVMSIGEEHREFLVSFDYLKRRLSEIGCDLLIPAELAALKLDTSTALFSETYKKTGNEYKMPESLQQFSGLNRWFIFRRRSDGSMDSLGRNEPGVAPTLGPQVVAKAASKKSKPAVGSTSTGRPIYKFSHDAAMKDDLGVGRKDWARYISTFTHSRLRDVANPSVVYPSLEAAFAAARYQLASDKPELGARLFATVSTIHQNSQRKMKNEGPLDEKAKYELYEAEGAAIRKQVLPAEMAKAGASFNEAAWIKVRDEVMAKYIQQRYETDSEFKRILDAVKAANGILVFHNGSRPSEIGGVVKGNVIEGDNKLGKQYMAVAGMA
jgi:hypothetical protein